jgi:hypothetical protein
VAASFSQSRVNSVRSRRPSRRELKPEQGAEGEDMVGIAAAIGVVAAGRDLAVVVEQPVEQSRILRHAGSKPVSAILLTVVPRAIPFTQDEIRPHYSNDRTGWLPVGAAGLCQIRTFTADEANSVVCYALSASSSAFASLRSGVSKPSVNQP